MICSLGWHSWMKWSEVLDYLGGKAQFRKCYECGKTKMRWL